MLRHFPNGLNTFPYARISPRIVEEGDQLNNYISEGSSPSEQGTGKLGSEPTRLVTSSWTGEIVVNQETSTVEILYSTDDASLIVTTTVDHRQIESERHSIWSTHNL